MINKQEVISEYKKSENHTGSPAVQVALLTARINNLTKHLEIHPKDNHSRRGLLKMVATRRKLLKYTKDHDHGEYIDLISRLGLRK